MNGQYTIEIVAAVSGSRYIAKLITIYGEQIEDDYFVEKFGQISVKDIIRSAKDRSGGTKGYAEAIFMLYTRAC